MKGAAGPEGWRRTSPFSLENQPNNLSNSYIRLQKFCGQPCPHRPKGQLGRGRSTAGARTIVPRVPSGEEFAPNSRALCATQASPAEPATPATYCGRWGTPVCPFLRAHEPNPAGLGLPLGTLAGEMLENCIPRRGNPAPQTKPFDATQFTNRRMRTFIATPSARKVNSTEDPP